MAADEAEKLGGGVAGALPGNEATGAPESERRRQRQRDLDQHDRMTASRAAHLARDTLHDSTPFEEPGSYTVYEARDRAAHTPSIAREMEKANHDGGQGKIALHG